MTLRPGSIKKPEAQANEISSKPGTQTSLYVKPAMDKTSAKLGDMSGDLQKILENEAENYKDQVQSFVDLCDTLSSPGWQLEDVIDYIHMLVRSVNLDVLSIVLTEPSGKGKLAQAISRGYKYAPGPQIVAEWESSVNKDATVNWDRLMDIAADKNTKICRWILGEGLHSVGYVPIHDNTRIYGFMLVGVYENKMQSALASSLLELCGNRIGLVLETRRGGGTLPAKAIEAFLNIKDHLSLLASCLEVMKLSAKVGSDDVMATSEKCLKTLAESRKLVDIFANELNSSSHPEKGS
jgi:hypothetical protein